MIAISYRRRSTPDRPAAEAALVDHDVDELDVALAQDVPWL